MQIIFSMKVKIFTLKYPNRAENPTDLAETLKIVGPRGVHGARFFQLQAPLTLGGVRVPPSAKGSGEQDCRGKLRAEALLKPGLHTYCIKIQSYELLYLSNQNNEY